MNQLDNFVTKGRASPSFHFSRRKEQRMFLRWVLARGKRENIAKDRDIESESEEKSRNRRKQLSFMSRVIEIVRTCR